KDTRIKVRGYRVQLTEIEDALQAVPSVEGAVCCAVTGADEDVDIVAYIIPRREHVTSPAALRRALRQVLPSYMVPSGFVIVDAFPLTPHGKVDRGKLMQIEAARASGEVEKPRTPTESLLAAIWERAFELPGIGRQDDFFELGGDSLTASIVAARLHDAL